MSDLLIAIGGTGQNTALAVSRLVFLGVLPKVTLATIDSDDAGELSTNLKTFGGTVDDRYGLHPLTDGQKIYSPFDRGVNADPRFKDLFVGQEPRAREVFELMFDETSAEVQVQQGMYGRPSLGATIFAQHRDEQLEDVFSRAGDADRVFVTGSLVGGTGAGILHQMIKALVDKCGANKRIYAIVFLRWFDAASIGKAQTVSNDTMERNMRYGLDYFFKETRPRLKDALLIGSPDKPLPGLPVLSVKAGDLGEKTHFFHLLAAYGLLQLPQIGTINQENGAIWAAAYERAARMYEERWGSDQNTHSLAWHVNRARFAKEILDYATSEHYTQEVEKTLGTFSGMFTSKENVGAGLQQALKDFRQSEPKVRFREMGDTWRALCRQYSFSLDWLDQVLGPLDRKQYVAPYTTVEGNQKAIVEMIQKLWRDPIPRSEKDPTAPDIARQFHNRLVEGFSVQGGK